ncbi:hypothetical protein UlMin_010226 [Ulmus minor]
MKIKFFIFIFIYLLKNSYVCEGKCEDIPDCDGFCKNNGFQGGQCLPPLSQFCCCLQ